MRPKPGRRPFGGLELLTWLGVPSLASSLGVAAAAVADHSLCAPGRPRRCAGPRTGHADRVVGAGGAGRDLSLEPHRDLAPGAPPQCRNIWTLTRGSKEAQGVD